LDRAAISGVDVTTAGGNITFNGPVGTDTGAAAVGTGTGGGHVLFNDTLDLGGNLTVAAGTGEASFSGAVTVGGHNLTVTSSTITTVAAGISGTTGNVDIAAATRTDVDGAIALTGAGNIELDRAAVSGVDVTTAGGNITFNGPASTDADDVEVNAGEGGGDVLFKDKLELGANLTIVAGGVQFNGTVDSRTGSPRSLEVRAGDGGVVFGGSVGDGGAGRELGNLTVQTTGVLSISDGVILRTGTSSISNLPLQLSVDEKDPGRPFGSGGDRVQRLVGIGEGTSILFVQWADVDAPGAPQTVKGGDVVQLFTSETGDDQWELLSSGDRYGPVTMVELSHEYPIGFLLQLIADGRNDLRVFVTLTSDESIRLGGASDNGQRNSESSLDDSGSGLDHPCRTVHLRAADSPVPGTGPVAADHDETQAGGVASQRCLRSSARKRSRRLSR
jgi:hypothetical protein